MQSQTEVIFLEKRGFCPICEKNVIFTSKYDWLRDHYICNLCASIPRERALMNVINDRYPDWRKMRIHESSPGTRGASIKLKSECSEYVASQYDLNIQFGKIHPENKYRSEDLENQTFESESFDLVITQDVFEHIFDVNKAFKEISRTLKPNGAHIFTTPIVNKSNPTQQRARRESDGSITHIYPPEYHGNPVSADGSLVTWHWGFDIINRINSINEGSSEIVETRSPNFGIEGEYLEVIVQKK